MSKNKSKSIAQAPLVRNPLHDHPLMQKGGAHEKPYKTKRSKDKQKLKKEWCCLITFQQVILNNITSIGTVA